MEQIKFKITSSSIEEFNKILEDTKLLPEEIIDTIESVSYKTITDSFIYYIHKRKSEFTVFGNIIVISYNPISINVHTEGRVFTTSFTEHLIIKSYLKD